MHRKTVSKTGIVSKYILYILVAFMPFHYIICELLISGSSIDNLWREALIAILFAISITSMRIPKFGLLVIGISIYVFILSMLSPSLSFGVDTARTYVISMFVYFGSYYCQETQRTYRSIIKIITVTGFIIALWGLFEALVLGAGFMERIGYDFSSASSFYINGFYGVPRVLGTFVSANDAGSFYALAIFVSLYSNTNKHGMLLFAQAVMAVALVLTFSRSAILALLVALVLRSLVRSPRGDSWKARPVLPILIGTALIAGSVVFLLTNERYGEMVLQHALNTFTGTDASAAKHWEDLFEPLGIVLKNPLGFGFATSGPRAIAYYGEARAVESSFYLAMYDMGILLGLVFFLPYLLRLFWLRKGASEAAQLASICAAMCLVIYALLPSAQGYILPFFFYLLCGCADGSRRESRKEPS